MAKFRMSADDDFAVLCFTRLTIANGCGNSPSALSISCIRHQTFFRNADHFTLQSQHTMRIMQQILRPALRSLRRHARPVARSTRLSTPLRAVTTLPSPILSAISQFRQQSTASTPSRPLPHKPAPHRDPNEPIYQLTFTCKVCSERSSHTISKQGYHRGTILITCSGCKNRHLIADHLRVSTLGVKHNVRETQG